MTTYDTLDSKLKEFYIEQDSVSNTKENIDHYLSGYNLVSKVADSQGNILYEKDDNGKIKQTEKGIAYDVNAIIQQNQDLIVKDSVTGEIDQEKTKEKVDELTKKVDKYVHNLTFLEQSRNYSRFYSKYGNKKNRDIYSSIPSGGIRITKLSDLKGLNEIYFKNSVKLMKNILSDDQYKGFNEKLNSGNEEEISKAVNGLVLAASKYYKNKSDNKFDIVEYTKSKSLDVISAINELNQEETKKPLMKNDASSMLVRQGLFQFLDEEDIKKEAFEKTMKKYNIAKNLDQELGEMIGIYESKN